MINDVDHLVQVLVICRSSLQKCLFRFPASPFTGVFGSFALELCELLFILKTDPLLVTSFANIMRPPPAAAPSCGLLIGGKFAPCRTVGNVWEHLGVSHRWGVSRLASGEPRPGCPSPRCLLRQHRATPCKARDSSTPPRISQPQTELEEPQGSLGQWCNDTLPPERPLRRS